MRGAADRLQLEAHGPSISFRFLLRAALQDPPVRVAEFESGGADVVAVVGDLDVSSAPQLSRVLEHALDRREAPLLVDLTDTSFLDSRGLATIVAASVSADSRGSRLAVVVPENCHIRRLLRAVDDAALSLAASRSQALLQ